MISDATLIKEKLFKTILNTQLKNERSRIRNHYIQTRKTWTCQKIKLFNTLPTSRVQRALIWCSQGPDDENTNSDFWGGGICKR